MKISRKIFGLSNTLQVEYILFDLTIEKSTPFIDIKFFINAIHI